jgi:hypothetical protein|uniref:Uncharacterized protein n=1 Tax=viral metagenome TaxID=1070528 RepID=A0A6C0CD10_9ZZZZ
MFADIAAAYYRGVISLYLNEDSDGCGSDNNNIPNTDDEYLFNARDDEDMPQPLKPLELPLFSYC